MSDSLENVRWQRKSREEIFSSDYVNLYKDAVELPDGEIIPDFYIVNYGLGAAGIVLEDENHHILLVRHYRYPVDQIIWEVPAGRIDIGEKPILAAKRELLEETGYDCVDLRQTGFSYPAVGNSDLIYYFFKGSAFEKVSDQLDEEIIQLKWFSRDEIKNLLKSGEILSGLCQSCLLYSFLSDK